MDARFRIRTRKGRRLTSTTAEDFARLVREGVVGPADMVHDALTRQWAQVRTHPLYQLVYDPLAVARPQPHGFAQGVAAVAVVEGPETVGGEGLDLQLTELPPVDPDAEAREFIARMEEERRREEEEPPAGGEVTLSLDDSGGITEGPVAAAPTPQPPAAPPPGAQAVSSRPREELVPSVGPTPPAPSPADQGPVGTGPVVTGPVVVPGRIRRRRRASAWLLVGAASAAALLVVLRSLSVATAPPVDQRIGTTASVPLPLSSSEAAVRTWAWERFVGEIRSMRTQVDLGEVPEVWLSGAYLAGPTRHPGVRDYWARYIAFVEGVLEAEMSVYRDAYLEALDAARVRGPMRSLRLAGAVAEFEGQEGRRQAVYSAALELAQASLALHDLVVALEGRVTHEPARGPRLSADPVLEAAGRDAETQERLEAGIDRVMAALHGASDAGLSWEGVPDWVPSRLAALGRAWGNGGGVGQTAP